MGLLDAIGALFGGGDPQPPPQQALPPGLLAPEYDWKARLANGLGQGAASHSVAGLLGGLLDPMGQYRLQQAAQQNELGQYDVNYYRRNQPQQPQAGAQPPIAQSPADQPPAFQPPQMPAPPMQAPQLPPVMADLGNSQPASGMPPLPAPFPAGTSPRAPALPMAMPPSGGNQFMMTPATALSQAREMGSAPKLAPNAMAMYKLVETMLGNGTGVRADGSIGVLPGADTSKFTMSHADELGKVLAGNNKDNIVGPGAALFNGPRTLPEYTRSLQPGASSRPSFVNPNPTAQNIINMPGAAPFFDTLGKDLGTEAGGVLAAGDTAAKQLQVVQAQRDLLQLHRQAGGSQGVTEPMKVQVAAILQATGIDPTSLGLPKDAGPAQALDALSKKAALGNIGPGGLPANNFSEADRKFIQSMQGGLGDTAAGWEAKNLIAQRMAERSIEAQNSLSQTIFAGAPQEAPQRYLAWKTQYNANSAARPLFSPEDKAKLASLANIDKQAAPGGASRGAPAVGTVQDGYRFKGGNPADPNSWQKVQ